MVAPTIPTSPIVNAGLLYVDGLSISYSIPTKFILGAGVARDALDTNDIVLSAPATISLDHVGINGLDTGTLTTGFMYAVYVIGDSTGYYPTAGIFSLSYGGPKMPIGYDLFRRVGFISTDVANLVRKFYQTGTDETREYFYDTDSLTEVLFEGSSTTFDEVVIFPSVPIIPTEVTFIVKYEQGNIANKAEFSTYGAIDTVQGMVIFGTGVVSTQYTQITVPCGIGSLGFPSILYRVGTTDKLKLNVSSYVDHLW